MADDDKQGLPPQGSAGVTDLVTQLLGLNRNISALVQAYKGRISFGTVTLAAAATTVVPQTAVQSNSKISLTPTNAAAGTLVGSAKSPYISVKSPGVGFTIATANATNAVGTETFDYTVITPS